MDWSITIGVLVIIVLILIRFVQGDIGTFLTRFQKSTGESGSPQKSSWLKGSKTLGKLLWLIIILIGVWIAWASYKHPEKVEWIPVVGEMSNDTTHATEITLSKNEYLQEKKLCGLKPGRWTVHVEDTELHMKDVNGEMFQVESILGLKSNPGERFRFVQNESYSWGLTINKGMVNTPVTIKNGCVEIGLNLPLSQVVSLQQGNYALVEPTAIKITFVQ